VYALLPRGGCFVQRRDLNPRISVSAENVVKDN